MTGDPFIDGFILGMAGVFTIRAGWEVWKWRRGRKP